MPLITTGQAMTLVGDDPWCVTMPMEVEGTDPPMVVHVRATKESLEALDPSGTVGERPPVDVARGDRMRIETAASAKFDQEGLDKTGGETIGGTLTLGAHDFPSGRG